MDEHVQQHTAPIDVEERTGRAFSIMKGIFKFFDDEAPNVANSKDLTTKEITVVMSYAR